MDEPVDRFTFFSNRGIKLDTATLISFSTLIFARYLHFITATAENPSSHKKKKKSQMELKFSECYHLGVNIHLLLTSIIQFIPRG
jgi:hypothetical protein